jgi:hypothetical protein
MATTIQQRLRQLCDVRGVSPEALSLAAGLSRGYLSRIITDPTRKGLRGPEGYRIAFEAKCSLAWLLNGVGSMNGPDVPHEPPPPKPGHVRTRADYPDWVGVALEAIKHDPELDWAVMGAGEQPPESSEELGIYSVLAAAERFKRHCASNDERIRLDEKAEAFRQLHTAKPATAITRRSSHPPKQ